MLIKFLQPIVRAFVHHAFDISAQSLPVSKCQQSSNEHEDDPTDKPQDEQALKLTHA